MAPNRNPSTPGIPARRGSSTSSQPSPFISRVTKSTAPSRSGWPDLRSRRGRSPSPGPSHSNRNGTHMSYDDEHTWHEIDLNITNGRFEDVVGETHAAMSDRIRREPNSVAASELEKYTNTGSPPNSPTDPDLELLSPEKIAIRYDLQRKTFGELLNVDGAARSRLRDLTGIREWWTANKILWREQREDLERIQRTIALLLARDMDPSSVSNGRHRSQHRHHSSFQSQVERLHRDEKLLENWFEENRLVMNEVYSRYKNLKLPINDRTGSATGTTVVPLINNRAYSEEYTLTEFKYPAELIYDIRNLDWFKSNDIPSWVQFASRDIKRQYQGLEAERNRDDRYRKELNISLAKLKQRMAADEEKLQKENERADMEIFAQTLTQLPGSREQIDAALKSRSQAQGVAAYDQYERELEEAAHIAKLEEINAFNILIKAEAFKNKIIQRILEVINAHLLPGGRLFDTEELPDDVLNELFTICQIYDWKQEPIKTLRNLFGEGGSISYYKRERIQRLFTNHYERFADYDKQLKQLERSRGFNFKVVNDVRLICLFEYNEFKKIVVQAQEIVTTIDISLKGDQRGPFAPGPLPPPLVAEDVILPKFSLLRSRMPVERARELVSEVYTMEREVIPREVKIMSDTQTYHEVITDFFTSPNVFPMFNDLAKSWSQEEFTNAVNRFIINPLPRDVLEAFIVICHRSGELFYITPVSRRIRVHAIGWETCTEQAVGGPRRNIARADLPRPRGIDKIEQLLRDNTAKFNNYSQVSTTYELQDMMNHWDRPKFAGFIQRRVIRPDDLRKYLDYWSLTGDFFVWDRLIPDRSDHPSQQRIVRIVSGWPLDYDPEYKLRPLLPKNRKEKEALRKIEVDVKAVYDFSKVRDSLSMGLDVIDEHKLYSVIYHSMRVNIYEGVSRHMFHLFLRECNARNRLFTVRRNGTVKLIATGWPDERRQARWTFR